MAKIELFEDSDSDSDDDTNRVVVLKTIAVVVANKAHVRCPYCRNVHVHAHVPESDNIYNAFCGSGSRITRRYKYKVVHESVCDLDMLYGDSPVRDAPQKQKTSTRMDMSTLRRFIQQFGSRRATHRPLVIHR